MSGSCYLTLQCDGVRLTLGTNAAWPRRMFSAAGLYLTANVLQHCKLASDDTNHCSTVGTTTSTWYYYYYYYNTDSNNKYMVLLLLLQHRQQQQ